MGRFATKLAATVANIDNLPPKERIPSVSLWDAVLPRSCTDLKPLAEKKPLDPNIGMRMKREFYDVKKAKNGQKVMVAHKNLSSNGSKNGGGEDVKKNSNGKENSNGKNGGNGNGKGNGDEEKKNGSGGVEKKSDDADFTPEEDEKLKEMKADNKTWKQITEVMGRTKGVLQTRFKELNQNAGGGDTGAPAKKDDDGKKNDAGKKNDNNDGKGNEGGAQNSSNEQDVNKASKKEKKAEKAEKAEKAKKEALEKKATSNKGPSHKAPSNAGSNGQARFTMNEWMTLQEDDIFSFGELQCLSELMMRDERQRWMRIASSFYDKTGRRVHPEDVREKFMEMSAV